MLSSEDLEKLIAAKKNEIEYEKSVLGLSPPLNDTESNKTQAVNTKKQGKNDETSTVIDKNGILEANTENDRDSGASEKDYTIPPELDRYIRRYLGLPVMLKVGEFSPNNPLVVGAGGGGVLGLGEYERRRDALRKIRQNQYREYLDEQAKKKQEAKEQAEKQRKEQEERERLRDEQIERERDAEREKEKRLAQLEREREEKRRAAFAVEHESRKSNKVDTAVQVGISRPLSVAVQTDDIDLYRIPQPRCKLHHTEAERELSPRTVRDDVTLRDDVIERGDVTAVNDDERPIQPAPYTRLHSYDGGVMARARRDHERRHTYMPALPFFDADQVQARNLQTLKEAAERRLFYQQELRNQIQEQQRIREERKTREKLLEAAELRRLEEQLRMLRAGSEQMKENSLAYDRNRTSLQREIDSEQLNLKRASSQPNHCIRRSVTSKSDNTTSRLNFHYPPLLTQETNYTEANKKKAFSTNIPDNSIFSPNYDVDSYLRRNLNPNSEVLKPTGVIVEAIVHEKPKEKKVKYEPSFLKNIEEAPIPVLRHSPKVNEPLNVTENLSENMQLVEDKWKVPAVQKNILKSLSNEQGKNVSILTQLGSIRRQLQLEQLRLDEMVSKSSDGIK